MKKLLCIVVMFLLIVFLLIACNKNNDVYEQQHTGEWECSNCGANLFDELINYIKDGSIQYQDAERISDISGECYKYDVYSRVENEDKTREEYLKILLNDNTPDIISFIWSNNVVEMTLDICSSHELKYKLVADYDTYDIVLQGKVTSATSAIDAMFTFDYVEYPDGYSEAAYILLQNIFKRTCGIISYCLSYSGSKLSLSNFGLSYYDAPFYKVVFSSTKFTGTSSNNYYVDCDTVVFVKDGESIPSVEPNMMVGYSFAGWYEGDKYKETLFNTQQKIHENKWLYGHYEENDYSMIYFGSYPQTLVRDNDLETTLATIAGTLPTSSNSYSWIGYGYFSDSISSDYMWYKDVTYNGEKYRGVYFDGYRPIYTSSTSSINNSCQHDNGYNTSTIYWFKWEPIRWQVLNKKDNKALVISDYILDSQDYYWKSVEEKHNHCGGNGYSSNYELSDIRSWLSIIFSVDAFSITEYNKIQTTKVENGFKTTSGFDDDELYVCNNTSDKLFFLSYSEVRFLYGTNYSYSEGTDYAKCQGLNVNIDQISEWWTRTPDDCNSVKTFIEEDRFSYHSYYPQVNNTSRGVRPAMWVEL